MHILTKLIKEDMIPALGVTEPGAIAFAVASAKSYVKGPIQKVLVALNSGMYKNAYTCGIPNSDSFGNVHAAALGAIAGDASLGLQALEKITDEDNCLAEALIQEGKVLVTMDHIGSRITIDATVVTEQDTCTVCIRDSHTAIHYIKRNETILFQDLPDADLKPAKSQEDTSKGHPSVIHDYSLQEIVKYVSEVSAEELAFIQNAYPMNLALLSDGLASVRTSIGPMLFRENGSQLFSSDIQKSAQLLCNGAIEARVLGLPKPAMSITGSGAHGIIATMPLYAYYKGMKAACTETTLLRGTALSFLITMYIKEYSGRLSAFCGCGIAAGTGMACGLALMKGMDTATIGKVIQNMASGLTGMICDGGNQGCAMKGIVAVDAAFRAVSMAGQGVCISHIHGINGNTPEETMHNMGKIASPGMIKTEDTILEIIQNKL